VEIQPEKQLSSNRTEAVGAIAHGGPVEDSRDGIADDGRDDTDERNSIGAAPRGVPRRFDHVVTLGHPIREIGEVPRVIREIGIHEEDVVETALGSRDGTCAQRRTVAAVRVPDDDLETGIPRLKTLQDVDRRVSAAVVHDNQCGPVREQAECAVHSVHTRSYSHLLAIRGDHNGEARQTAGLHTPVKRSPGAGSIDIVARRTTVAVVLGIRPDVIRASLVLKGLRSHQDIELCFIWSGQHYSDNLKDVFFRELNVEPPDVELGARGETDAEVTSEVILRLSPVLAELEPAAAVFLGDTNTVMGCIAAAQLNIPIVHIEGCMRAYDWRMPEEKYRTTIDHLSDVIYTYFPEYLAQAVAEGLNPRNIVVVQNLIVDVLNEYYFKRKQRYDEMASDAFFADRGIERGNYYLMTCHRRENVHIRHSLEAIVNLVGAAEAPVYFTASYRTQRQLEEYGIDPPSNVIMVDPIGYEEMLVLMANAKGVITDSGTIVEETAVLGVPSVQLRKATERPQVYDCRSSVKFDPARAEEYPADIVFAKVDYLAGTTWEHGLGDGKASQRIVDDLARRAREDDFRGHLPEQYHIDISRSYRDDGLADVVSTPLP
jgi:UDP-N-acetylglucosamine 2-epimerase